MGSGKGKARRTQAGTMRTSDQEKVVDHESTIKYYQDGKFHRVGGPAVEYATGRKEWWQEGKKHRIGGPAVEHANGGVEWWVHDERHREDGPAEVRFSGPKALRPRRIMENDGTRRWRSDRNGVV